LLPSVFAGTSGLYSGLGEGRNASVTAGVDLARLYHGLFIGAEIRGRLPILSGQVVGEKALLGGMRIKTTFHKVRPYADLLMGRGNLIYQQGGYAVPAQDARYLETYSSLISPGAGVEINLSGHLGFLVDGQLEHWRVPFQSGGANVGPSSMYSKVGTLAIVYRFGW
jgi:hypothetical protein